ncbi:MAG: adenylyl-sulfate kinase [Candidatus Omnitrophica bacterium]|nr:adenylyl-sulfate kinase [Candidatus Omnitrophota bacterium]
METQKEIKNIVWQNSRVGRSKREFHNQHKSVILWFTGLSGAGKSSIALALERKLAELNKQVYVLDGDNIRHGLNSDLGFSPEDREENIRRVGEVAKLFMDAGMITIVSFISPYKRDRNKIRQTVNVGKFVEVFIDCNIKECERRDPKGLYAKARSGEIKDFTGISSPYEEPQSTEIIVNTDEFDVTSCVAQISKYLVQNQIIPS